MLTRLQHAGVLVEDIETAVRFYRDAVGLVEIETAVDWDSKLTSVYLEAGGSAIALFRPWPGSGHLRADLDSGGEGLHHLCFETDDASLAPHDRWRPPQLLPADEHYGVRVQLCGPRLTIPCLASPSPVTNIDHIVIQSNESAAVASHFTREFGLQIRRVMSRPGSGAHLEFARLDDLVLEFAGPGEPNEGEAVTARAWGIVLAVTDLEVSLARLRDAGYDADEPRPAIQPGARLSTVQSGSAGVPFALIQYSGPRPAPAPVESP